MLLAKDAGEGRGLHGNRQGPQIYGHTDELVGDDLLTHTPEPPSGAPFSAATAAYP
jgi:hypothetical protein